MRSRSSRKREILQHEQSIAGRLGGHAQPNSGALDHRKGDVELDTLLLDSKETHTSALVLSLRDINKIAREAAEVGKDPGLVITLWQAPSTTPKEWVAVPLEVFAQLLDNQKGK